MKEVSISGNIIHIKEENSNTTIFLHEDIVLKMIHLVEYNDNRFKRRIEFKKYHNAENSYLKFSIIIAPNICFSGEIVFAKENIKGELTFEFLKENSTSILETYKIEFHNNNVSLKHLINPQRYEELVSYFTYPKEYDIEIILFNMINIINIERYIKNQNLIPIILSLTNILHEERNILEFLRELPNKTIEIENFLNSYKPGFTRLRVLSQS